MFTFSINSISLSVWEHLKTSTFPANSPGGHGLQPDCDPKVPWWQGLHLRSYFEIRWHTKPDDEKSLLPKYSMSNGRIKSSPTNSLRKYYVNVHVIERYNKF